MMVTARRVSWDPQYLNGSVPRPPAVDWDSLGHYLHPEAAAQLKLMSADFTREFGHPILTSETDRIIAEQVRLFNLYRNGQGFPAAEPGTSSHGECVAIDIYSFVYRNNYNSAEHRWLRENGPAYGWDWYLVGEPSGELWHFNYIFGLRRIIAPAWGTNTEEEELMGALDKINERFNALDEKFKALEASTGRGGVVVLWNKDTGHTYSIGIEFAKSHGDEVERNDAYLAAGQLFEQAVPTDTFNLIRHFRNFGLGDFANETDLTKHPRGFLFKPGATPTWR